MCNSSLARCLAAAAAAAAVQASTKPMSDSGIPSSCDVARSGVEFQPTHVPPEVVQPLLTDEALTASHAALESVCEANSIDLAPHGIVDRAHRPPASEPITPFHSGRVPPLSLEQLGSIMKKATRCEQIHLWMALVLCRRVCASPSAGMFASVHSMHRLYIGCLHVAIKTHCDRYLSNAYFAQLAGVSATELNDLELAVLKATSWSMLVTSDAVAAMACNPALYFSQLRGAPTRLVGLGHAQRSPAQRSPAQRATDSGFSCTRTASPWSDGYADADAERAELVRSGLPSSVASPVPSACSD